MGKSKDNYEYAENRPGHDTRYSLDSSKIRNNLGWKSTVNFDNGLKETIDWYLKNKDWWKHLNLKILDGYQWK